MSNGQADTSPESIDSLAEFLVDNSDADAQEDLTPNAEAPEEDNAESDNEEDATVDDDGDEPDSENAEKPPSDLKFKLTIKGEDGTDQTVEVGQTELIAGYQRHADYTRKTTELANRERDVTQTLMQKAEEGRNYSYFHRKHAANTS
jgi:hypothetical protein